MKLSELMLIIRPGPFRCFSRSAPYPIILIDLADHTGYTAYVHVFRFLMERGGG